MRRLILTVLLAVVALPLQVPAQSDPAADIARRLQAVRTLGGNFEQRKLLAGFAKPLVSRGSFLMVQGKGVLWHTRTPFESWLRVTPQDLSERRGELVTRLSAEQQPALREMNGLLLALLSGDTARLAQRFLLDARNDGARWTLRLTPREASLAGHIRRIELGGAVQLEKVLIEESSGDRTEILFSSHNPQPAPGSEEAQRLEQGL